MIKKVKCVFIYFMLVIVKATCSLIDLLFLLYIIFLGFRQSRMPRSRLSAKFQFCIEDNTPFFKGGKSVRSQS